MRFLVILALAVLLLGAGACTDPPSKLGQDVFVPGDAPTPDPGPTPDAIPDAPLDGVPDTAPDTVPDTALDTAADTVPDTAADTVPETAADTVPDTAADTVPDTAADTALDTAADTVPDTATDTVLDTAPDTPPCSITCDDANPCTVDDCDGEGCSHTPSAFGLFCDNGQTCDATGLCGDGCWSDAVFSDSFGDPDTYADWSSSDEGWQVTNDGKYGTEGYSWTGEGASSLQHDQLDDLGGFLLQVSFLLGDPVSTDFEDPGFLVTLLSADGSQPLARVKLASAGGISAIEIYGPDGSWEAILTKFSVLAPESWHDLSLVVSPDMTLIVDVFTEQPDFETDHLEVKLPLAPQPVVVTLGFDTPGVLDQVTLYGSGIPNPEGQPCGVCFNATCDDGDPCTDDACNSIDGCVFGITSEQISCGASDLGACDKGVCVPGCGLLAHQAYLSFEDDVSAWEATNPSAWSKSGMDPQGYKSWQPGVQLLSHANLNGLDTFRLEIFADLDLSSTSAFVFEASDGANTVHGSLGNTEASLGLGTLAEKTPVLTAQEGYSNGATIALIRQGSDFKVTVNDAVWLHMPSSPLTGPSTAKLGFLDGGTLFSVDVHNLVSTCDDDNPCTAGICNEQTSICTYESKEGSCADDGKDCTADLCQDGVCAHGLTGGSCLIDDGCVPAGATEPGNACAHCDGALDGYAYTPNPQGTCGDADLCTDDQCVEGACVSTPKDCDDDDTCTVDSCSLGNCLFTGQADGLICGLGQACIGGTCVDACVAPAGIQEDFDGGTALPEGWIVSAGNWEAGAGGGNDGSLALYQDGGGEGDISHASMVDLAAFHLALTVTITADSPAGPGSTYGTFEIGVSNGDIGMAYRLTLATGAGLSSLDVFVEGFGMVPWEQQTIGLDVGQPVLVQLRVAPDGSVDVTLDGAPAFDLVDPQKPAAMNVHLGFDQYGLIDDVLLLDHGEDCDDQNQCTVDSCDPALGCVHVPGEGACWDDLACTVGDSCVDGECVGTPVDCTEYDGPCSQGICDPETGSCLESLSPDGSACVHDEPCVTDGQCQGPSCVGEAYTTGPGCGEHVFVSLSAGVYHTCGVRQDGLVVCWGNNASGQCDPPPGSYGALTVGQHHSCALEDGQAVCWGANGSKQTEVPDAGVEFTSLSAGTNHTCGLLASGDVLCWGLNDYKQGDPPQGPFDQISAGNRQTCGIREGDVICWGCGDLQDYGQCADKDAAAGGAFVDVTAAYLHSCALDQAGIPTCWGWDEYSQSSPPAGPPLVQITAGDLHTCGLDAFGDVSCWGSSDASQDAVPASYGPFSFVTAGGYHTCAIRESDGRAICWGDAGYGQLLVPTVE